MIQRVKKYLLHLVCIMILAVGTVGCDKSDSSDNSNENIETINIDVRLAGCWHLVSFCDASVDVDIYINFDKSGQFKIYQRTEGPAYTVFGGTCITDEVNAVLSGIYSDGTEWNTDYKYTVDTEAQELILESVATPDEVSVYKSSSVPVSATLSTRSASADDVKPL